jgi:hypothetical protein
MCLEYKNVQHVKIYIPCNFEVNPIIHFGVIVLFTSPICEKYQSRDEKFPEPNVERNLVSRLVFFANTLPKHDLLLFLFDAARLVDRQQIPIS